MFCIDQKSNPSSWDTNGNPGDLQLAEKYSKATHILKDQIGHTYKYYNGNGVYKIVPY